MHRHRASGGAGERAARRRRIAATLLPALLVAIGAATAAAAAGHRFAGRPLAEALRMLRDDGLKVVFSTAVVRPTMRVRDEPRASAPRAILDQLLAPHDLTVEPGPGDRLVVVVRGAEVGAIAGTVLDRRRGAPIAGVEVRLPGTALRVTSGAEGTFRIAEVPAGRYRVEARLPGYAVEEAADVEVGPRAEARVHLLLAPAPIALDEIEVTPSRYSLLRDEPMSHHALSRDEVERLPHLADDVYRALAYLPGTAGGDLGASLNVRGGEQDELLVLIDGLQIYEPFHLKDFQNLFSIIDSQAVGGVDFLTGGFAADYGGAMSGVIDITSVAPEDGHRFGLGVSFVNARLFGEGSLGGGRGRWLVSARRGYLDLVFDWLESEFDTIGVQLSPVYYDVLAKAELWLGERTILSGHALAAFDDTQLSEPDGGEAADGQYGNRYAWLRTRTAWSPRLYSDSLLSIGRVDRDRKSVSDDSVPGVIVCDACDEDFAEVRDQRSFDVYTLEQDWSLDLRSDRHRLRFGLDLRWLDASYDYRGYDLVLAPLFTGERRIAERRRELRLSPSGSVVAAFAADRFRLGSRLTVEAGLRFDRQSYSGDHSQWSPRLSAAWSLGPRSVLRAAWGHYYQAQGIHELQVEDGVDRFFPAQRAEHRLLALEHVFANDWRGRIELYDKALTRLRPRFENLYEPIDLIPESEIDRVRIDPERGRARGVELVLEGTAGSRLAWWLSYVRSSSEDRIDGRWQPRAWDQPDAASARLRYQGPVWYANLAFAYHSGWPTTPVSASVVTLADGRRAVLPALGVRNSERYPAYRRVDLRLGRAYRWGRRSLEVFFEVINLTNERNVRGISDFDFFLNGDGSVEIDRDHEHWLPLIPSFGVSWSF